MGGKTLRVTEDVHALAASLASETGESMSAVLAAALTNYQQRVFWDRLDAAMQRTRNDPDEARELAAERLEWEPTLRDDLEDDFGDGLIDSVPPGLPTT
jgi:hypothetical protein